MHLLLKLGHMKTMTATEGNLDEQPRMPADCDWWDAYDSCRKQGYTQAWSAWNADVTTYGRAINNPEPKVKKENA